jgi:glyoxylase-like metal-dependent hydrolase (beta-lactamase superfamily II)
MLHESRSVGRFEVIAILDAEMPDEPVGEAFPGAPADALAAARTAFPGVYTDDGRWHLRIRAWVVRDDGGSVLVDTGIGGVTAAAQAWATGTGTLRDALGTMGVVTDDIATVVISHAHDDHTGGVVTDDGTLLCPNARHVVQRADLGWARDAAAADEEWASSFRPLAALEDAGMLDAIEGDHVIGSGLTLRHLPGHTPGHQVVLIEDGERMVLSADTWNHPVQLRDVGWWSGTDDDHEAAAASRRALLADLDAHPGTIVAPTHFAEAFGEVRQDGDGWTWSPA